MVLVVAALPLRHASQAMFPKAASVACCTVGSWDRAHTLPKCASTSCGSEWSKGTGQPGSLAHVCTQAWRQAAPMVRADCWGTWGNKTASARKPTELGQASLHFPILPCIGRKRHLGEGDAW